MATDKKPAAAPCILVSACLLGLPCRYDGSTTICKAVTALTQRYTVIPVCPEQMGGLSTPRDPSEIQGAQVITVTGRPVTEQYQRGATATLQLARLTGARCALLKARSPSCGKGQIYDGTFSKTLREGNGITAELLLREGVRVFHEEEIECALDFLNKIC